MNIGEIWDITLGKHTDQYVVTFSSVTRQYKLRRLRVPKTKADAARLPEHIDISMFGAQLKK